jgi:hypothetical protein
MTRRTSTALAALGLGLCLTLPVTGPAAAGPLENLERERAILLRTLLDPDLDLESRARKAAASERRLVDLERMVLRDDSLSRSPSAAAARAFADYDLTFLVHAAVEGNRPVLDHWLSRLGLSSSALLAARAGRR